MFMKGSQCTNRFKFIGPLSKIFLLIFYDELFPIKLKVSVEIEREVGKVDSKCYHLAHSF